MEEPSDIAVSAKELSKSFLLPLEKKNSLKELILHFGKSQYSQLKALRDINFEIKRGEFFGIIGRNGSGKSTLLKIIGGIYQPSAGEVKINGTLTPFIELGIGFNPELTGRENVFLNGAILGLTRKEIKQKYDEIVAFSELQKFMDQKLKNYSSGMQVRLAFSIAIQAHNDILLIDEVLAVGDMIFQEKCFDEFLKIKNSGKTVIFVSHDVGAVERFCDRAMILKNGKNMGIGPSKDMVFKYTSMIADEQYDQQVAEKKIQSTKPRTGDIVATHAEIISNGSVRKHINYGQPFTLRTYFEVREPDPTGYIFGASIIDHNGISILAPNTKETKFALKELPESGYIDMSFGSNPISPGRFSVDAAFFSAKQKKTHSYIHDLLRFKILGQNRHGIVYMEPKWRVGSDKT